MASHTTMQQVAYVQCTVHADTANKWATEVQSHPSVEEVVEPMAQRPPTPEGGCTGAEPTQEDIAAVLDRIEGRLSRNTGNGGLDDPEATPVSESQA